MEEQSCNSLPEPTGLTTSQAVFWDRRVLTTTLRKTGIGPPEPCSRKGVLVGIGCLGLIAVWISHGFAISAGKTTCEAQYRFVAGDVFLAPSSGGVYTSPLTPTQAKGYEIALASITHNPVIAFDSRC